MKKVGIVSLYYKNYNYGGMLQAYALTKACENLGYEAYQIRFSDRYWTDYFNVKKICRGLKTKLNKTNNNSNLPSYNFDNRREKFQSFQDSIKSDYNVYNRKTIKQSINKYDYFICGSDQVWNSSYLNDHVIYMTLLSFVSNKKRISYAASLGKNTLTEKDIKRFKLELPKFSAISVREKSMINILQPFTNTEIINVVDPTLLLTKNDWDEIVIQTQDITDKYICCYFLGEENRDDKLLKNFSIENSLRLASVPFVKFKTNNRDLDLFDIICNNYGPREFLGLIFNSECVATDSFHAIVFSVIFHKKFIAFKRNKDNEVNSMNNRISDFLSELGLADRIINDNNYQEIFSKEINWEIVDEKLLKLRESSYDFLKNSLEGEI